MTTPILTITNPITILFFIAVFAGLGLSNSNNGTFAAIQLISGVFAGSCIWWLILCGSANKLKKRISKKILKQIDLVSGILILFFGLLILMSVIKGIK